MANNQDHVWCILRDVLELLAGAGIPTPERGYALDGGWSLALSDLRRLVNDRNALRVQVKTAIAERDQLRAERDRLAADNERLRAALQPIADRIKAYPPWMWTAMVEREKQGIITGGFRVGGEAVTHMPAMLLVQAEEALAATPAQSLAAHDAAVKVEVLLAVAEKLRLEESTNSSMHAEFVEAEADRIKMEAAK